MSRIHSRTSPPISACLAARVWLAPSLSRPSLECTYCCSLLFWARVALNFLFQSIIYYNYCKRNNELKYSFLRKTHTRQAAPHDRHHDTPTIYLLRTVPSASRRGDLLLLAPLLPVNWQFIEKNYLLCTMCELALQHAITLNSSIFYTFFWVHEDVKRLSFMLSVWSIWI